MKVEYGWQRLWVISMSVFYMIIKAAVRNGIIEAHEVINQSNVYRSES